MRMKLFGKLSQLHSKLVLYPLIGCAVGLGLTVLATAISTKVYLDRYLMEQTAAYAQQIVKEITATVERDKETLATFVLSDTVRDLRRTDRLTVALERLLSKTRNFLEGFVIDSGGKTVAGVSLMHSFSDGYPDFGTQAIYREARRGKIAVSGWENLTEKSRPYWHMATPIEQYPGKIIGVLLVTVDLRRINDIILTSQGAKYGDPILIDRQARVLVHLDRSKLGSSWDRAGIARKLAAGQSGTAKYHDRPGRYLLAAYQPLPPYGWGLIVQIPPEQTLSIIWNRMILLFGFMAGMIFIILVVFVSTELLAYRAAGQIVTPIKRLTEATQQFGRGRQLEYQPVSGDDEIAQLSVSFYDMALQLTDFEKQRAGYISMIAHDLRNPLSTIQAIFRDLQHHGLDERRKAENLAAITLKLEQVNRMVNDLLEFSRLDLGQVRFEPEPVSVRYLCQDVIAGYLEQRNRFQMRPFPETLCVWADPVRLQQILQNILDNCLKYTPAGSAVVIDCRAESGHALITVSDSGDGIPEAVLANLFKPFQSGSPQQRTSYGLGIAIAKKLALAMGGDLSVQSVSGQGTTFTIRLPLHFPQ
ncbi:signal transduction histidine kinase [Hydrogenispora ethanolica]|uniref:histidine kinase n=1 Tax=Hydrogenispora ethanolica TaxID=1082276 RepID=A0A4R1QZB5_HYDET|nr:sensor histidine kinase [Hydrogenispora ethanolica]TCL58332.1 signal transduction histidine kinase [Hydrogenispora ethanolica]